MRAIERERVERVARLYATNLEASRALGINLRSFSRLCRRYGIETPHARRTRRATADGLVLSATVVHRHPWRSG